MLLIQRRSKRMCVITFFLSISLLQACAGISQYHQLAPETGNCITDRSADKCKHSYIQDYGDYMLAIAEYTERGNHFDDKPYQDILEAIRMKSEEKDQGKEKGVVTVVFVHGWKHNSSEDDLNLQDFRKVLAEVAKRKDKFRIGSRNIVGVYVGWRGLTLKIPGLNALTYWERKAVAEQLGNTGLTRLLTELDAVDRSGDRNVMVTIGHSFGGAAVLSAVTKPLLTNLLRPADNAPGENSCNEMNCGVGDGIFLINPAIEANQVLSLLEATVQNDYATDQPPLLVSLSSEADFANKYFFPLGQTLGLIATSKQVPLEGRSYFKNFKSSELMPMLEENLDSTAVGNFTPFLTHRIDVPPAEAICAAASISEIEELLDETALLHTCSNYADKSECGPRYFPSGLDRTPENLYTERASPYNPLYFIRTDQNFMGSHNDIFNPHVVAFLVSQLDQGLEAVAGIVESSNALYQEESAFREKYARNLEFACQIEYRSED